MVTTPMFHDAHLQAFLHPDYPWAGCAVVGFQCCSAVGDVCVICWGMLEGEMLWHADMHCAQTLATGC